MYFARTFWQITSYCAESSSSGPKKNSLGGEVLEEPGEFCDTPAFAAGEFSLVARVHALR